MQTLDAAKGKWGMIFGHYGLPPVNPRKHFPGECPVCKKKGKLRIDDKTGNGEWICVHGSGYGVQLLQDVTGKDFKTLAREIDRIIGNDFQSESRAPTQHMDKVAQARDRFLSLDRVRGTDAERYFHSRGLYKMPARGIRYSQGEVDHDAGRPVPCIYAIASNEYGEPVYKHLTYIENGAKAKVPTQRKMHKLQETFGGSVAVKMFEAREILGIGEGIESALSAESLYALPVWSSLNAELMPKFRAPTGVKILYIFADNDNNGTGLAAAFSCGRANILANNDVRRVIIRWPKHLNDFNDMLLEGDDICSWELTK